MVAGIAKTVVADGFDDPAVGNPAALLQLFYSLQFILNYLNASSVKRLIIQDGFGIDEVLVSAPGFSELFILK